MASSMTGSQGLRGPTGQFGNKIPSGYRAGQLQQFTPKQMELFSQLFSNVSPDSYLSKLAGGDESLFNEIESPALQQFQGTLGGIASRFSGMGTGSRKSSGFQNTVGNEASNFAQQLQSNRQSLQRQALQDLIGFSSELLGQSPYENFLVEKKKKQGFGGLIGAGLGGVGGFFAGGPAGAMTGAQLGYGIGSAF